MGQLYLLVMGPQPLGGGAHYVGSWGYWLLISGLWPSYPAGQMAPAFREGFWLLTLAFRAGRPRTTLMICPRARTLRDYVVVPQYNARYACSMVALTGSYWGPPPDPHTTAAPNLKGWDATGGEHLQSKCEGEGPVGPGSPSQVTQI